MSVYRIFRCGIYSHITRHADQIILRRKLEVKFLPIIVKKSTESVSYETHNNYPVVYVGPLSGQIKRVKLFTIITSMSGIFAQPVIYERAQELETSTPVLVGLCSFVGFFTFVTPLLLHFVTKKYVTQISYDEKNDSYIATVITLLLRKREIYFKPGEPVVPDILGMFTSMTVRGIPLFIDARFFEDVNHYKKIMGYDKPLDLKLYTSEKPKISQSH